MTLQNPHNLNSDALILRQIGEALYGATWQAELSKAIGVSDRSMRRWAAGTDAVPSGVWRDIHYHAESRWRTIQYFDEEVAKLLNSEVSTPLRPIPNSQVLFDQGGLHFALHTDSGRPVRCYVRREVLDDRAPRNPMIHVLNYFKQHADIFYNVAQRKFDAGDFEGDLIAISNADVMGEDLPDIRYQ
jgi:Protein of unknown function (DUF1488)